MRRRKGWDEGPRKREKKGLMRILAAAVFLRVERVVARRLPRDNLADYPSGYEKNVREPFISETLV